MISPETVESLLQARSGSLRETARKLKLPEGMCGTLSDILRQRHDHVTRAAENRVRVALGLPPIREYTVPACSSCGGVHTGDCHGKPVAQVVILAPGERVRKPRKPAEKWVAYATSALRAALINRQPMTGPRYYDRLGRVYTTREEFSRGKNH